MTGSAPAHVGIVACSAEGAALCYRTICLEGADRYGAPDRHPQVSLHGHPLADYVAAIERGWRDVAELMLDSARRLAAAGATFLLCPDNTIHNALPYVLPRSPLPWLHIAEVVAADAEARGFRRVGLLGTRWLVDSEVYPDKLGARDIAFERPAPDERDECSRIIMDELVRGIVREASVAYYRAVIARMAGAGCDAVVLGCTEIPLIIDEANSALPTLDSTRLLARAALRKAAEG